MSRHSRPAPSMNPSVISFTALSFLTATACSAPSNRSCARFTHSPMQLDELVGECVNRARILHHIAPDSLRYEPGPPLPILGDYDEVHAAVSNLIENAVKYSGKELGIEVGAYRAQDRFAEVRVKDHGQGIPRPELKRIFKRFYRINSPGSTRIKGTGLGLYIVRSVAKRHGGRAWAESS